MSDLILARNYTAVSPEAPREVGLVVVHTAETELRAGAARAVAAWFAGPSAPEASAHWIVDCREVLQCVREENIAWAAPGANQQGIHIELAARAAWNAEAWATPEASAMLQLVAELAAGICTRHAIPLRRLGPGDLLLGGRGICGHVDVSRAWKKSDHYDPGDAFPWGRFLELCGGPDAE